MHESGTMEDLDNKWILLEEKICESKLEQHAPTLGLKNMAGVFILVGTGIFGGIALIAFEIIYKQHQTRKLKRIEIARNAVDKWKGWVEVRGVAGVAERERERQRFDHLDSLSL